MRVPLVNKYRAGQPFALKSRLGIAFVFGYMADSEGVSTFMQRASKKTRSYYVNANCLNGFVIPYSITKYFKRDQEQNEISEVTRH